MSDSSDLPLISESDCSPVPVFNCQIILRHEDSGQVSGRAANLKGISATGSSERDVLIQITKVFKAQVQALSEEKMPIPWIEPAEQPEPDEVLRFVPVHL